MVNSQASQVAGGPTLELSSAMQTIDSVGDIQRSAVLCGLRMVVVGGIIWI